MKKFVFKEFFAILNTNDKKVLKELLFRSKL